MVKKHAHAQIPRIALIIGAVLIIALLCKFFLPFFRFDLPLGYDVGIYRYLFVRHAEGFPPFMMADIDPWARGHPLGLFFISTILIRLGIPADWLIGWIWNLFPVVLIGTFAWLMGKRDGYLTGLFVLVAGLLSAAYFDGFAAMYWKTFASLFWCILTFRALEKRSWLAVIYGILAVASHNQTGLLFGLVLITWIILPLIPFARSTEKTFTKKVRMKDVLLYGGIGLLILIAGFLTYLPVLQEAVLDHLPALLSEGADTASGNFPPALFYLQTEGILLLLGAYGFFRSVQRERWTLWQISALWCFAFVALHLLFYRRFFLQLDFFLLPFAALGMRDVWQRFSGKLLRTLFIVALIVQCAVALWVSLTRIPLVDDETFHQALQVEKLVPDNAFILDPENLSVVILRGWMPKRPLGGPGLFDVFWSQGQWEQFLLGTHADRVPLLQTLQQPIYMFVSQFFRDYYGDTATAFLKDPCFTPTDHPFLYRVTCTTPAKQ
jgi:hypothetical protein